MAAKIALLVSAAIAGGFIGLAVSRRMSERRKYFEELICLINSLISDFRFRQTTVAELVGAYKGKATERNLGEFAAYAAGEKDALELSRGCLTAREHAFVSELFSEIGTYDLDTQVFVLDNYKQKADEFYSAAREREKKYGAAAVKLGLLAGAAVGLMFT